MNNNMLENNDFKKRSVDDVKVSKSKEYLWKYIRNKTGLAAETAKAKAKATAKSEKAHQSFNLINMFMPKKIAWASALVVLVIIGILVGPNLQNLLQSGQLTTGVSTVSANFEMSANTVDSTGVAENSSFTLTSTEDYSADVIAQNLKATPEVEIKVTKTEEGKYTVTPAENLTSNKVYKFTIVSQLATGPEEFSWAYQVKNTFKIKGVLPGDKTAGVPTNTGIEMTFSHENYDYKNAANYFEILPAVKGKFEQHQSTLSFVPSEQLKPETLYTVTLKKDFPLVGSDQKIAEDKTWQFETDSGEKEHPVGTTFAKDYFEITTDQEIALGYSNNLLGYDEEGPEKIDLVVYKYSNIDEYIKAMQDELRLPEWSQFTKRSYLHDVSKLEKIGSFEAKTDKIQWQRYMYIPNTDIKEGFYLLQLNDSGNTDQALLQVTDLTSYISITKTKSLIWLADYSSKKPVKDAKIELVNKNASYTTNGDGVAMFDTPETKKDYSNPYAFEDNLLFKITTSDGKTLVSMVGINDSGYGQSDYWFSLTTDRPMYKPNDTLSFWGYINPKKQGAPMNDLKIKISRGWWYEESFLITSPITLQSDNTFQGEIKLENVPPSYYQMDIYSGDIMIASRGIEVSNYVKPTYNLTVTTDKKAIFDGEKFTADIKTNFFDGTPVPYMDLGFDNKPYADKIVTTDANGEYSLEMTGSYMPCKIMDYNDYCTNADTFYLNVFPKLGEDSNIQAAINVRVFNSKIAVNAIAKPENQSEGKGVIDIQTNWVDLTKLNDDKEGSLYSDEYLGEIAPNRKVSGRVVESMWIKTEIGEHYDFIRKEIVKDYNYDNVEKFINSFEVTTDKDGKAKFEMPIEKDRYYRVIFEANDDEGKTSFAQESLNNNFYQQSDYYGMEISNKPKDGLAYFDINENVEAAFQKNNEPMPDDTKGYFLFLQLNNGLQEYSLKETPNYSFKFGSDDVPSVYVQGLWINEYGIQPAYETGAYYKKDLKKLTVDVKTDKESYEPGDKVILYVETKDKDGRPTSANVNLNLVDEAYYKLVYDYLSDPLNDLYVENSNGVIGSSASHQGVLKAVMDSGMGGCFKAGTQILIAEGVTKPIEQIKVGDTVLTRENPYSLKLVPAKVTNTVKHHVGDYLLINGQLGVTIEHVVFANNQWKTAKDVKIGDIMSGINGKEIKVYSIKPISAPTDVYNFEVEGKHTYIADGFYVHNDKGGDGVRSEFEDVALFKTIKTGSDGKGSVEFVLPDNITSWRVSAKAINGEKLLAGIGVGSVKVSLPAFADLVMNEEYSVKDKPILKFRAFGDSLNKDDAVEFYITAKSLGAEKSDAIKGTAYNASYFELASLKMGKHDILVELNAGKYKDAVQEVMNVVGTRLKKSVITLVDSVKSANDLKLPKDSASTVFFTDAGRASLLCDLFGLFYTEGDRVDEMASALIANDLIKKYFDIDLGTGKLIDRDQYQKDDGGLSLFIYSESELVTSAMIAYTETNLGRYYPDKLKGYFYSFYKNKDANLDEVVVSLLGLASMNEPVLVSLQTIKDEPELTLKDKLYIALAFEKIGSKKDAEDMYNKIKTEVIKDGDNQEKALGAMLAANLHKKQEAKDLWDDVIKNGGVKDDIINLYQLGYLEGALEYANPTPVSFTLKTSGGEEKVELKQWDVYSAIITDSSSVELKDIKGDLAASVVYEKEIEPANFAKNSTISITRTYSVNGKETTTFNEGDMVKVTLKMTDGNKDPDNKLSFHVTDILPSGLKLMTYPQRFMMFGAGDMYGGYYGGNSGEDIDHPYEVDKQEVHFYWTDEKGSPSLNYYAKVVTPGEYYADPAKMEAYGETGIATISKADTVKINKDAGLIKPGLHDKEKEAPVETPVDVTPVDTANALVEIPADVVIID